MFHRLGDIAVRYRWLIVGFWLVIAFAALPFAPRASHILQSGGFVNPDAESQQALDVLVQKLHMKRTVIQVLFTSNRYTVDDPQFLQQTQQSIADLQHWSEVVQIVTFADNPRQISIDGHAAYVNVALKADVDASAQFLPGLERRIRKVPDLQSSVGGVPVVYNDIQAVSERDLRRAELLAFPFAIIAMLFVFRSVVAAILPVVVGGFSVVVALALIFVIGHFTNLSIYVLNITTLFGLSLGVDYSLFMVSRFREEITHGHPVEKAVMITVATAGRAVVFSGLTVSIGLSGLTFIHSNMMRSVGLGGILVVLLAVLIAVTLLPALLAILGLRVNALPVRIPELRRRSSLERMRVEAIRSEQHGFWYRLSQFVMRYPLRVFFPVLLLLVSFGLPFLGVRFSGSDASVLPTDVSSRVSYDIVERHFSQPETTPILVTVQTHGPVLSKENIDALYSYVRRVENDPRVERVDSLVSADPHFTLEQYELLYTHPQLIADPYLGALLQSTVSGDTALVEVISKYKLLDMDSKTLVQTIRNTDPGHGIKILVGGGTASNMDYVTSLYTDFPKAVLIVAITTYIVLLFLFRSLALPLKALVMNTLSILASYGALVVIFQDGFLHQLLGFSPLGFVEASIPILLFCSLFGLSMDYEVFLLSRIQEAFWLTGDNRRAVALGLQSSGGLITSAAAIIIVVCVCFATADIIIVKALGLGMALAVIMDATLVRGLLVPATMRLLGNWNWWLPFVGVQRHSPALAEYGQAGEVATHSATETSTEDLQLEEKN
jgi:RND superfamily putative drug exporter